MSNLPVFLDSNLLSIFTEIERLHLLLDLFSNHDLHVSPSVHDELVTAVGRGAKHIQSALDLITDEQVINITEPATSEHARLALLPNWMARGEAECIIVCQARGWVFASFDRKATNYCNNHNMPHLTLNQLLAALWQTGTATKDQVKQIINEIEQSGRTIRSAAEIIQEE